MCHFNSSALIAPMVSTCEVMRLADLKFLSGPSHTYQLNLIGYLVLMNHLSEVAFKKQTNKKAAALNFKDVRDQLS